jgi:hypothetical protein
MIIWEKHKKQRSVDVRDYEREVMDDGAQKIFRD